MVMESSGCCVSLDASALGSWRSIALNEGLATARDVAHFLIDLYTATAKERRGQGGVCQRCETPLSLYCTVCQLPADPGSVAVTPSCGTGLPSQHAPVTQQNLSHTLSIPRCFPPSQWTSVCGQSVSSPHALPFLRATPPPSGQQLSGHQAVPCQLGLPADQMMTTQPLPSLSTQPCFTQQVSSVQVLSTQVIADMSTQVMSTRVPTTQQVMSTKQVMPTQQVPSSQHVMSTQQVISTQQVMSNQQISSTQQLWSTQQVKSFEHTLDTLPAVHSSSESHCETAVNSKQSQLPSLTAIGADPAPAEDDALEMQESDAESEQKQSAPVNDSSDDGTQTVLSNSWQWKHGDVKGVERNPCPVQVEKKIVDGSLDTVPLCRYNLRNSGRVVTVKGDESKSAGECVQRNVDHTERVLCQDRQGQRHRKSNSSANTEKSLSGAAARTDSSPVKILQSKPHRCVKLKSSFSGEDKRSDNEVQDPAASDCTENGDDNKCDGNIHHSDPHALLSKDVLTHRTADAHSEKSTMKQNYVCERRGRGRPRSKLISGTHLGVLRKSNGRAQCYSLFECSHCQAVFDKKKDFNQHMSSHYPQCPHVCRKCGESFHTKLQLSDHKQCFHPTSDKPARFACNLCSAAFKTEGRFQRHRKLHEENKIFTCKMCRFVAQSQKGLNAHRLTHRGPAVKQCEYCGQTKRVSNLQRHLRMHRGEKPHACLQCDRAFRTAFDLKDHWKRRHAEVKPFSCEVCGKRFMCGDNLKHHLLVHSGQRPFKCTLCPSSFSRKDYLTKHVRMHTGERPYRCPDCSLAFASSSSVKQHHKHCHSACGTDGDVAGEFL